MNKPSSTARLKDTAIVVACALLIGINIAVFIFFPGLMHPVAIVLSNVITLVITVLAFSPVSNLLGLQVRKKEKELLERLREQQALEDKVSELEVENQELSSRLDTRDQTAGMTQALNYTFKLEQMEFAKKGYVVKEEPLDRLDPARYRLPEMNWWTVFIGESGEKKIQYIHKFYYKAAIGIDFAKVKYALDGNRILFCGVRFDKLHDISSELRPDEGDIDRCHIISVDGSRTDIKHDKAFNGIKKTYCEEQEREVKESLEKEVGNLCNLYTDIFRDTMQKRYPQVGFVDSIEDSTMNWSILNGNTNAGVAEIASNMLMLTNVLGKTQSAGEISFPQA